MNEPIINNQIGEIRFTVMSDTIGQRTLDDMYRIFPNNPPEEVKTVFQEYFGEEPAPSSMNCLLIQTADRNMLVDTGQSGQLYHRVKSIINPADIDTVIITHAHIDHVGGLAVDGEVNYPNADYFMTRAEWDYWMDETGQARREDFRKFLHPALHPIKDRLTLIDADHEFAPGIRAIPLPGHTPGQIGVWVYSDDKTLVHLADALHFPFQLVHTTWVPRFDADPPQAVETRETIIARAERENWTVLPYHFRFPGLGKIVKNGDLFAWQPAY